MNPAFNQYYCMHMMPLTVTHIGELTSTLYDQFMAINKTLWLFLSGTCTSIWSPCDQDISHEEGHCAVKAIQQSKVSQPCFAPYASAKQC